MKGGFVETCRAHTPLRYARATRSAQRPRVQSGCSTLHPGMSEPSVAVRTQPTGKPDSGMCARRATSSDSRSITLSSILSGALRAISKSSRGDGSSLLPSRTIASGSAIAHFSSSASERNRTSLVRNGWLWTTATRSARSAQRTAVYAAVRADITSGKDAFSIRTPGTHEPSARSPTAPTGWLENGVYALALASLARRRRVSNTSGMLVGCVPVRGRGSLSSGRDGEIGKRSRLKICREDNSLTGSIPVPGTPQATYRHRNYPIALRARTKGSSSTGIGASGPTGRPAARQAVRPPSTTYTDA